jgi:hypothetical protein
MSKEQLHQIAEQETERHREEALRQALLMPPLPHHERPKIPHYVGNELIGPCAVVLPSEQGRKCLANHFLHPAVWLRHLS